MTTAPVMSITDELIAELEAAARGSIYGCPTWLERDGYSLSCADASDVNHIVTAAPSVILALLAERAELKRETELYRFVRELAWYVDRASYIYKIGIHAPCQTSWSDQFVSVDADDVEAAIIAAIQAAQ